MKLTTRIGSWLALCAVVLCMPTAVVSGLEPGNKGGGEADAASKTFPALSTQRFQLRCWQYGKLIFDERNLEIPAESVRYVLSMQSGSKDKGAVHLVETVNATCLIRNPEW